MSTNTKPSGRDAAAKDAGKGEVVAKSGGAVALPEHMRGDVGKGTENLGTGDYEMPRIKLLQGLSEELQAFDGLKAGMFFHTLAEKPLGKQVEGGFSLPIVPLYISKRFVLWNPRHAGGGILARSDDAVHWNPPSGQFEVKLYKDQDKKAIWKLAPTVAASGLDAWGSYDPTDPKSQPAATEVFVIVAGLPTEPDYSPVALMLQRTALGPAKKLNGKLKISRAPIFGQVFDMSSWLDDRNGQKFNNYRFTASGFVEDTDAYAAYRDLHEQFKVTGVQVKDLENAQDDTIPVEGRDAANKDAANEKKF